MSDSFFDCVEVAEPIVALLDFLPSPKRCFHDILRDDSDDVRVSEYVGEEGPSSA